MEKAVVYNIGNAIDDEDDKVLEELNPDEREFVHIVRRIEDEREKSKFIQMCISLTERNNLMNLDDDELDLVNAYNRIPKRYNQWILLGMFKRMVEESICNEYK